MDTHLSNFGSCIDCASAINMIISEAEKAYQYYMQGDHEMSFKELADAHKMIEHLMMDYNTNPRAVHDAHAANRSRSRSQYPIHTSSDYALDENGSRSNPLSMHPTSSNPSAVYPTSRRR